MEPGSPYAELGLASDCSDQQIKKAFRNLSLKYHPDKCPGDAAGVRFKRILDAYNLLKDPALRADYDARAGVKDRAQTQRYPWHDSTHSFYGHMPPGRRDRAEQAYRDSFFSAHENMAEELRRRTEQRMKKEQEVERRQREAAQRAREENYRRAQEILKRKAQEEARRKEALEQERREQERREQERRERQRKQESKERRRHFAAAPPVIDLTEEPEVPRASRAPPQEPPESTRPSSKRRNQSEHFTPNKRRRDALDMDDMDLPDAPPEQYRPKPGSWYAQGAPAPSSSERNEAREIYSKAVNIGSSQSLRLYEHFESLRQTAPHPPLSREKMDELLEQLRAPLRALSAEIDRFEALSRL